MLVSRAFEKEPDYEMRSTNIGKNHELRVGAPRVHARGPQAPPDCWSGNRGISVASCAQSVQSKRSFSVAQIRSRQQWRRTWSNCTSGREGRLSCESEAVKSTR